MLCVSIGYSNKDDCEGNWNDSTADRCYRIVLGISFHIPLPFMQNLKHNKRTRRTKSSFILQLLHGSLHSCYQLQCLSALAVKAVLEGRKAVFLQATSSQQTNKKTHQKQNKTLNPLRHGEGSKVFIEPKPQAAGRKQLLGLPSPTALLGQCLGLLDKPTQELRNMLLVQFGFSQFLVRAELSREAFMLLDQELQLHHRLNLKMGF